jgi:hypothetical protein
MRWRELTNRVGAFLKEWGATMSGWLSVPFAILALSGLPGRPLYAVLAYVALLAMVFSQRATITRLEDLISTRAGSEEERREAHSAKLRATLYKIRDLIQETKHEPTTDKHDSLGALIKFADELESEEDVVWICDQLKARGHEHPFGLLELTSNSALAGYWLSFLQEARASSLAVRTVISAFSFAGKQWSHKDRYLKGRSEYAHWEETNPRPDGIKLLPSIDVEEPESPEETRDKVSVKLARYLNAGNAMLDKCRSLKKVENKEAEEWARDVGAIIRLAAGEVALAKFLDPSGIPPAIDSPFHDRNDPKFRFILEHKAIFDFVYPRCFRLRHLIDDIESGKIILFSKPLS